MNGMLRNCLRQSDYNRYTFFFSYYHLFGSFSFIAYTHTHCLLRFFTATFSGECLVKNLPTLSYDLCRVRVTRRTKKKHVLNIEQLPRKKITLGFPPVGRSEQHHFFLFWRGGVFFISRISSLSLSLSLHSSSSASLPLILADRPLSFRSMKSGPRDCKSLTNHGPSESIPKKRSCLLPIPSLSDDI